MRAGKIGKCAGGETLPLRTGLPKYLFNLHTVCGTKKRYYILEMVLQAYTEQLFYLASFTNATDFVFHSYHWNGHRVHN